MARYPHTKLLCHPRRIVVLSGPHIQVLDDHGCILYSTTKFASADEKAVIKSGPIRCSGMSYDGRYLATTGDDKRLKIWDLDSLTLLSTRALPKKPTSIEFSRNMNILVSDKFGDVFRYTLFPNNQLVEGKSTFDTLASQENPSTGELILGHASLLTSFLLTSDEKFIITADRDEHIRVSWYPEGYNIENYCLGHKKYVSAIHIPAVSPATLISGGDLELKVWDWMTGRLQRDITILAAVEPFLKVQAQKRRRELAGEDNDDEGGVQPKCGVENAGPRKRRNDAGVEPEDPEVHESVEDSNKMFTTAAAVFVVRRISSFLFAGETHVVFSMVGATAIFEFVLTETDNQPDIRHHDFGKPVIDFTVCGGGLIWVLLDADFPGEFIVGDKYPHKLIHAVQWSINRFADAGSSALLDSLNTICSLPATPEDLNALDLYSDLSSLPKCIDGEGQPQSIHEPLEDAPTGEDASAADGLTKRALGRLKHKRALGQLHREKGDSREISGPDTKKMKSHSDNEA